MTLALAVRDRRRVIFVADSLVERREPDCKTSSKGPVAKVFKLQSRDKVMNLAIAWAGEFDATTLPKSVTSEVASSVGSADSFEEFVHAIAARTLPRLDAAVPKFRGAYWSRPLRPQLLVGGFIHSNQPALARVNVGSVELAPESLVVGIGGQYPPDNPIADAHLVGTKKELLQRLYELCASSIAVYQAAALDFSFTRVTLTARTWRRERI
jgi:hypothetical protein